MEDTGNLDPREAARLLAQTEQRVRRELDWRSPWLSLIAAVGVFVAFGAVWLTVRGQHPYVGPTPLSLAVLYAVVAIRIGTVVYSHRRARAGIGGRSVRRHWTEGVALLVALVGVYVLMGALANAGASDGVVYGTYVVTATMLVLGVFGAARFAAREDREGVCVSLAIILVAAGCSFASPRGVWLANGIGCGAVLLLHSALQATVLRGSRRGA
jgi:hypothetical protein